MRRLALLLALVGIAAAPAPRIAVERAERRATQGGLMTTAAYFTVRNTGAAPDTLTGAACACARSAMLHESKVVNGVSKMTMAGPLLVPAGGELVLKPGGLHLMLTGLKAPIKAGETVRVTLTFAKAGKVDAILKASDGTGMGPMAGMNH